MKYAIVFLFVAAVGCASIEVVIPSLERRSLDISREFPGFVYRYRECTKKGIFGCRKWETRVDKYDLTDPATRNKLADMGFIAKVREPLP